MEAGYRPGPDQSHSHHHELSQPKGQKIEVEGVLRATVLLLKNKTSVDLISSKMVGYIGELCCSSSSPVPIQLTQQFQSRDGTSINDFHFTVSPGTEDLILKTEYDITIAPPRYDKSIVEYVLRKCYGHVLNAKGLFTVDIATGESYLFSDVEPRSRSVASALCRRGLVENDIVISTSKLLAARSFITYLGIWRANGSVMVLHDNEMEDHYAEALVESKSRFIFCDTKTLPMWQTVAKRVKWKVEIFVTANVENSTNIDVLFHDDGRELPPLELRLPESMIILPTSGTCGPSKPVGYTNERLITIMQMWELLPTVADSSRGALFMGKMSHFSTLIFPLGIWTKGIPILLSSKLDCSIILKGIETFKPQALVFYTEFFQKLIKDPGIKNYDLTSIECLLAGWSLHGDELVQSLSVFPKVSTVASIYAMTECPMLTTSVNISLSRNFVIKNHDDYLALNGSVGKLVPLTQLEVRDIDTGKPLPFGKAGELCFKSPIMFNTYFSNREATDLTIQNDWLITGDVGYYDEKGFIYVIDRRNEVSPTEIENVIKTFPAVAEACVVRDPTSTFPRAFVTLKLGETASADEIANFAHEKLESHKHLKGGLYIVPKLPRENTGKICRALVAKMPTSVVSSSASSSSSSSPFLSSSTSDINERTDGDEKTGD